MARLLVLALAAIMLAGCEFPRDPERTLDRVRGGVMRVGVTPADPWVTLEGGEPAGVEVELVKRFADTLDARVEWVEGSESDLMEALHGRQVDLVIAGLTRQSAWAREAALTRPYLTTQVVIAAPDERGAAGENAFLVALERFLLDSEAEAAEILEREGRP